MNFPCSSADLHRALQLRQQLEARLADSPAEMRPEFEELVGILVKLEQSHLALEWFAQLPSPDPVLDFAAILVKFPNLRKNNGQVTAPGKHQAAYRPSRQVLLFWQPATCHPAV